MTGLLAWAGLEAPRKGKLLLAKRIGKNREAWFFTNPERETVTETIELPDGKKASDILGKTLNVSNGLATVTVEPLDVRVLVIENMKI